MKNSRSLVSRRSVLTGAAAVGGGGLFGCSGDESVSSSGASLTGRPRVAVIGGGAGGIAAAYFLDPEFDVDLFESRHKVGGHCDTEWVDYQGRGVAVDLGAQFFHPDTHPIYTTLLEELGLFDPEGGDGDETIAAEGSMCIFSPRSWWPLPTFSSQHPFQTPFLAIDFAIYSQAARRAVLDGLSWEVTVEEWVKSLPVTGRFKDMILYPWISAAIGTTQANARRSSARSILQTFALAFPANIFDSATTYNSKIGLQGNLERLLDESPHTTVAVDAPVSELSYEAGQWFVTTPEGRQGPYEAVVMNAPPRTAQKILSPLPWTGDIVDALRGYEYFPSRLLIHTDPTYVHRDSKYWAAYNGAVDGGECEGSVWYGAIHAELANGEKINLFKSWASQRGSEPKNILHERNFMHPLITPSVVRCTRKLGSHQGLNGLYFSGQHTTGMDLQESAVYSAMKVAERLAPGSSSLASLKARLAARGREGISYDV